LLLHKLIHAMKKITSKLVLRAVLDGVEENPV